MCTAGLPRWRAAHLKEKIMGWSWRVGRIAGIDVYVHFTFLLLIAWIGFSHYAAHGRLGEAAIGVLFILALFGIIVLHELGHALAARRYGITTRDITLLPIGGVARLERMPDKPWQELVVALAGPAVNVVIAASIYVGLRLGPGLDGLEQSARIGGSLLNQLFWINVSLAAFNLLPAFPMDGGRVLRALLAMRMDYVRATKAAAAIGQAMALVFAFAGLFSNTWLLLIALFVWMGASQEASMVQMRSALRGIPVMQVMVRNFVALHPGDTLAKAADFVIAGFQQDFPVVDEEGRLEGVLTRNDLIAALASAGASGVVRDVAQREFIVVHPRDMLEHVLARFEECNCRTLPVVDQGRLVGLVTSDNLAEALLIQGALQSNVRSDRGGSSLLRPTRPAASHGTAAAP
jgi:Zn-dependent protease